MTASNKISLYIKIQEEFNKLNNASAFDAYSLKCKMFEGKGIADLTEEEFEDFTKQARKLYKERNEEWKNRHKKKQY